MQHKTDPNVQFPTSNPCIAPRHLKTPSTCHIPHAHAIDINKFLFFRVFMLDSTSHYPKGNKMWGKIIQYMDESRQHVVLKRTPSPPHPPPSTVRKVLSTCIINLALCVNIMQNFDLLNRL